MRFTKHLLFLLFAFCLQVRGQNSFEQPQTVSFPSGEETLQGYLWMPEGNGPFRAVVWSHGKRERLFKQGPPTQFARLAKLYVENNYVFFIPDRLQTIPSKTTKPTPLDLSLAMNDHMIAALSWLRQQSFVDSTKVAVSGTLTGGLQALLAAQRDATVRGAVIFSPGAAVWDNRPDLRGTLTSTVENLDVPVFLIQPQNDNSLKPSETLGPILLQRGGLNRTRIYPPFKGHVRDYAVDGVDVWGKDVLTFINATMK